MTTTFTWGIKYVNRTVSDGVVNKVRWTLVGVDGDYTEEADGGHYLPRPTEDGEFIPYEELTEEVVLNWLFNDPEWRGREGIEAFIQSKIDAQKEVEEQGTPWESGDGIEEEVDNV